MENACDLPELVPVNRRNVKRAAHTLGRAFADYEMIRHYFPTDSAAATVAKDFLLAGVFSGMRVGEVYATSQAMEGVAVWIPPGIYPLSTARRFVTSPVVPLLRFLVRGGFSMMEVGQFFDRRHVELMPRPHWYLEILGVDPTHQGGGYSSRLVRAMYKRADAQSVPIYVETVGETNSRIYRHLGFTAIEESLIPGTPLPYSCLIREPTGT